MCALIIWVPQGHAAYFTVDDSDFSEVIGDMLVTGTDHVPGDAGTGQNFEMLRIRSNSPGGTATNEVQVGEMWDYLAGIPSVTSLVFGFDVNEPGNSGNVVIDALLFQIGEIAYTLGDNQVQVNEYLGSGSASAEAYFRIDLPFDFMAQYNAGSTENFFIQATLSDAAGGFEEFFLSRSATQAANEGAPVPEPGTLILAGMGALGLFGLRRRSAKNRRQA